VARPRVFDGRGGGIVGGRPRQLLCRRSHSEFMTDQQSLDDVAMLLMHYPGVSSARGFLPDNDGKVWIRFRCNDFTSLKAISSCAVAANVLITVGDPDGHLCYESSNATDLPFDVQIEDEDPTNTLPTASQIFGVFLARNLKKRGLVDSDVAGRLQRGWNAIPM
jgi:hypothetical protein